MLKTVFATTLLTLTASLALAQRPDFSAEMRPFIRVDAPVVALTNVTVIDGTGAPSKAGQTVVIDGDRIVAVRWKQFRFYPVSQSVRSAPPG